MTNLHINKLAIVGVGLIGGSLARALRNVGVVQSITGIGRNEAQLVTAKRLGVIDDYSTDIAVGVNNADMIVLAVPMGAMQSMMQALKPVLTESMCVTDVGSAKGSVLRSMQTVFGHHLHNFIPGHPIAGTENSGVEASYAELFRGRRVILTPHEQTTPTMLDKVEQMWRACGAEVTQMSVEHHDEVLAATSHLPHMLAYALVDTLARMDERQEIFEYAAGGFRDFTRIASSNPEMWHDICVANQDALLKLLQVFRQDLDRLIHAIQEGDSRYLKETFSRAKQARDNFCGD